MRFYAVIAYIFVCWPAYAQKATLYNINSRNGLPSDHVYSTLKDRYGYLWIATTKGVVKYNGYTFKIFNIHNGIANDEVWQLYEDRKGRIWLCSISDEIGYIYHDKYKKAYLPNADPTIYPQFIAEDDSGIVFTTKSNNNAMNFYWERNDTIHHTPIPGSFKFAALFTSPNGKDYITTLFNNHLYKLKRTGNTFYRSDFRNNLLQYNQKDSADYQYVYYSPWLWTQNTHTGRIYALNMNSGARGLLPVESTFPIYNMWSRGGNVYVTLDKYTYIFNEELKLVRKINSADLAGFEKSNFVSYITEGDLWGTIYSTSNGMYIDHSSKTFKKYKHDLSAFRYVGTTTDSCQYWWNKTSQVLASIKKTGEIVHHPLKGINIKKILPFDTRRSLVLADNNIFWMDRNNYYLTSYFENISNFSRHFAGGQVQHQKLLLSAIGIITDGVMNDANDIYIVARGPGLYNTRRNADSLTITEINTNKLYSITPDTVHKFNWVYNNSKVYAYNYMGKEKLSIERNFFDPIGIRKIENIAVDNYGHIFLKDYERLFDFDPAHQKYRQLLKNYNLQNAVFNISGNKIIVAGKFGLLFGRIKINGDISNPVVNENIRDANYSSVYDVEILGNNVLLNTDKGTYVAGMPAESAYTVAGPRASHPFNFLVIYKDSTRKILWRDTISIDQKNPLLQFDVINPYGNGMLRYKYRFENYGKAAWNDMDNNDLHLPSLQPGRFYTLSVIAGDDAWRSRNIKMHLYVVPYWWQTTRGQRNIALMTIVFTVLFIFLLVYFTNKIAVNRHLKKNRLLSLELKSIYAQINPHFIFNSLNTGLYFIKEERTAEAYEHISSFSELLRSYIRSARNKFITVAEEIENLTNYISLQQSRFENKFDFRISADESLDTEHTCIPSLLLQPLVENAIVHGLLNSDGHGNLEIEFIKGPHLNELVCIIDDNGIGREQSRALNQKNTGKVHSYGSDLVKDLISLFNTYKHAKIEIEYIDKQKPLTGTKVIVIIKNFNHD